MHLGFGLPPEERTVGAEIPILVVLADDKSIAGTTAVALVQGPDVEITETVPLVDDGNHMDGDANDGVYGGVFTMTKAPGQYLVKATAWGTTTPASSSCGIAPEASRCYRASPTSG
jgi:hypothetical protein